MKIQAFKVALLVSVGLLSNPASSDQYFKDSQRGWYWYEEPESEQEAVEAPVIMPPKIVSPPSPREILKKQGEAWENALAETILDPSVENYRKYLQLTAQIQEQSQGFAKGLQRAAWVTPELDYRLQSPSQPSAIMTKNHQQVQNNEQELFKLSKANGILFFFRGDCPYCHKMAPILKRFSDRYQFTIIPVSMDGGVLPEFPYPKQNYDMGKKLNVSAVPALFLVNPDTNRVSTIGYGYTDTTALIQKTLFAAAQMDGTAEVLYGEVK